MKKLHVSFMAILFALFAMVSFTACSSDDDGLSSDDIKTNIVGMWQMTHISGWGYDDTEDEIYPKRMAGVSSLRETVPIDGIGIIIMVGIQKVLLIRMRCLEIKSSFMIPLMKMK